VTGQRCWHEANARDELGITVGCRPPAARLSDVLHSELEPLRTISLGQARSAQEAWSCIRLPASSLHVRFLQGGKNTRGCKNSSIAPSQMQRMITSNEENCPEPLRNSQAEVISVRSISSSHDACHQSTVRARQDVDRDQLGHTWSLPLISRTKINDSMDYCNYPKTLTMHQWRSCSQLCLSPHAVSNNDNVIVLFLTAFYASTVLHFQVPLCGSYNIWSVSHDWFHAVGNVELRRKSRVCLMTFADLAS